MYVNAKQRANKKQVKVFYIYLCESHRVDGKVKNTQRYVGSINEERLAERDYSFLEETKLEITVKETELVKDKLDTLAEEKI